MLNKILRVVLIIFIIIGIYFGISITIKREMPEISKKEIEEKLFTMIQNKTAEVTSIYTYGKSLNISGKFSNVNKDNFESVKIVITDGKNYQEEYSLNYDFEENSLIFSSNTVMNSGLILDKLEENEYYLFLRLKLNNNIEPKYYSFSNTSNLENITYYTVTDNNTNRKVDINFTNKNYNNKEYNLLKINMETIELPEEIFDIVIDAGHGGTDIGEKSGSINEADITLEYAKLLKQKLEENGYKVKLTRDDTNTDSFTTTNMYDADGRIGIACASKSKLMISFHLNNGANNLNGFEIYSPCNCNLLLASTMANKIKEYSSINYSNNNSFKKTDGVYVRNYTKAEIASLANTANKRNYDPYDITTNTPYLYTIREVGGIATGAYVDGRNTSYSKNKYYNSNQGIECYQIELGYIKNDLEIIQNEKENFIRAITESICEKF